MAADVPAHIAHPTVVQNGVKVQAGSNWDLSRGAVATPIVTLPEPVATPAPAPAVEVLPHTRYVNADKMPANAPLVVVRFDTGASVVEQASRADMRQLDKSVSYVVGGHASANEKNSELAARKRANAVAAEMKKLGFKVVAIKSFGERRPLTLDETAAAANRRVDVIATR